MRRSHNTNSKKMEPLNRLILVESEKGLIITETGLRSTKKRLRLVNFQKKFLFVFRSLNSH